MSDTDLLGSIIDQIPGSLSINGVAHRLSDWTRSAATSAGNSVSYSLSDSSGLTVMTTLTRFDDHPAIEWSTKIRNDAETDSAVVSDPRPLDLTFGLADGDVATLATTNGSLCQLDDFLPWHRVVDLDDAVHLEPVGGRSSDGAMPFFTVATSGLCFTVGVGWSGQWSATITRSADAVRVRAGLAHSRLRLHSGETITLPSFLVAVSEHDADAASNAFRAVLESNFIPHGSDGCPATPLAHMTMSAFHVSKQVSEETELAAVRQAAALGLEAFWVDACWYGDTPMWAEQVGNWSVRREAFPRGLRPISDAAHAAGMKFVLWIEPERARVGTRLVEQQPDFFLTFPHDPNNLLLDLGNPAARAAMLEMISGYIDEFAVDIYRQDFNIRPLPAWQAADQEDRQGIHEIRHVEGLYWLWDQLLERHPGLVIDNCASGGRRIDLETMRRSVPLWRSDSADVGGGAKGDNVSVANQVQVSGLSRYVVQHTGPVWAFDPYHIRSAISTGFVVYCPLPNEPEPTAQLRSAISEIKRLRPVLSGDFHSLLEPTLDQDGWSASQFHRPGTGDGAAVILRRPQSNTSLATVPLCGLDPAGRYRVTMSPGYQVAAAEQLTGAELVELRVSIPAGPGSLLVEYAPAE